MMISRVCSHCCRSNSHHCQQRLRHRQLLPAVDHHTRTRSLRLRILSRLRTTSPSGPSKAGLDHHIQYWNLVNGDCSLASWLLPDFQTLGGWNLSSSPSSTPRWEFSNHLTVYQRISRGSPVHKLIEMVWLPTVLDGTHVLLLVLEAAVFLGVTSGGTGVIRVDCDDSCMDEPSTLSYNPGFTAH